jgi:hypothetical protein
MKALVQFTMYYTFFFNVDAVVCQNNGQFQVWELNIWQFIVIVEIEYFLNLNEYYLPIFIRLAVGVWRGSKTSPYVRTQMSDSCMEIVCLLNFAHNFEQLLIIQ